MEKQALIEILKDWNFWGKPPQTGIPRALYLSVLKEFSQSNQIISITGPRRAGKSFLMKQLAQSLIKDGVHPSQILLVNFEDPRFTDLTWQTLEDVYQCYLNHLRPSGPIYVFLDEIQEIGTWEKWVRTFHELGKGHLIISGSNANLLGTELSTLLTGRHLDCTVLPLSFREFLLFKGMDEESLKMAKGSDMEVALMHYLEWGGFPEVFFSTTPRNLLFSYYEDLLSRDLIQRFNIRKPQTLKSLAKYYLSNSATLTTFGSIEKFLQISADTAERFSDYLAQAYLIRFLPRFSFKVKEQEKSPRKIYAIDPGFCNAIGFRFSENIGKSAETVVFWELQRRRLKHPEWEFYYWKDDQHREVDFVIKEGLKVTSLIQVCWSLEDPKTKKREIHSLLKALNELQVDHAFIITGNTRAEETVENKKIFYVPLAEWLLSNEALMLNSAESIPEG